MIIYKATNKTTKKEYVGLTKNELSNRKADHKRKAKSGKSTMAFHDAIRKYGFENFEWEIIDTVPTLEELNEKEIYKTIKDAREKNNITNYSGISEVCRGKRKTCGGFKWEFFEK